MYMGIGEGCFLPDCGLLADSRFLRSFHYVYIYGCSSNLKTWNLVCDSLSVNRPPQKSLSDCLKSEKEGLSTEEELNDVPLT